MCSSGENVAGWFKLSDQRCHEGSVGIRSGMPVTVSGRYILDEGGACQSGEEARVCINPRMEDCHLDRILLQVVSLSLKITFEIKRVEELFQRQQPIEYSALPSVVWLASTILRRMEIM